MTFVCAHCGRASDKPASHINRSRASGLRLFCGRRCFGLGRRKHKTKAEKTEEKRAYDAEYRRKNATTLKAKKAAQHKATYDPVKAAVKRKKRMPWHAAYCRRPEYRRWKSEYDRQFRASKYGPFAEAYMLLLDTNREIKTRITNYDKSTQNDTLNKSQARRRGEGRPEREPSRRRDNSSAHS